MTESKYGDVYWTIDKQMERAADPDNQITGGGGDQILPTSRRKTEWWHYAHFRNSGFPDLVEVPCLT